MADSFTISVELIGDKAAIAQLEKLQAIVSKPMNLKINVDTTGLDRLSKAELQYLTSLNNRAKAEANVVAAGQQRKTAEAQLATATQKSANAQKQAANGMKQYTSATQQAAKATQAFGASIGKYLQWYAIGSAVSGMVNSFRSALSTMKEVDAQLTNIQKVSNMSASELKKIGDAAYDTASKYGVAADEYLSAVYTFQKAGLGDSATKLGELATKTMLVGDTTADVASRFLVATNAAWGLGGSMEKLSKVVDEADYINNNYATDLQKLSDGMPIVASTAANMNMTIEETLAVLGTITASTQESGRKAATAWRALSMNLAGELGTITDEVDGNIEVTKESIKSVSDALKIYGNDSVKAAQQSGKVIDPMEAVISLAQAYKDGLLTDIELQNILMNVGGKLRTNQLTALVKDLASETSIYKSIMESLPNAIGTADAEIGIKLSSWESKTQILKNTWTEFISHMANTDALKGMVTGLTTVIQILDSAPGRVILLTTAFLGLSAAIKTINFAGITKGITAVYGPLMRIFGAVTGIFGGGVPIKRALSIIGESLGPAGTVVAGLTAIYGLYKGISALTVTTSEAVSRYTTFVQEKDALEGELRALEQIKATGGTLTAEESARLKVLQDQTAELEKQAEAEKQKLIAAASDALGQGTTGIDSFVGAYKGTDLGDIDTLKEYGVQLDETELKSKRMASSISAMRKVLQDLSPVYSDLTDEQRAQYDGMAELITAYDAGDNALLAFVAALESGYSAEDLAAGKVKEYNEALAEQQAANAEAAASADGYASSIGGVEENIKGATAALQSLNEELKGGDQDDAFKGYADAYKKLMDEIEAGRTNSNTFKSIAEAFFGDLSQIEGGTDEVIARARELEGLFGDASSAGYGFVDALAEIADESGNVYDAQGNVIATLEDTGDAYNLNIQDLDALAEKLGITTEAAQSLVSALDVQGITTSDIDSLIGLFDELGIAVTETADGVKHIDSSQLELLMTRAGYSKEEIQRVKTALEEAAGVSLDPSVADMDRLRQATDFATSAAETAKSAFQAAGQVSMSATAGQIGNIISLLGNAINSAHGLQSVLQGASTLASKVAAAVANRGFASGTDSAPGGPALVNEEGPEIIKEGGDARIAGGGMPTVTNLKPGAVVYTAEETREILESNPAFVKIKAYAGGTLASGAKKAGTLISGIKKKNTTTKSKKSSGKSKKSGGSSKKSGGSSKKSGGGSSKSSGGGGSSSTSTSTSTSSSSSGDDPYKEQKDEYKGKIDLAQSELQYLEKSNATMDERIAKQRELQDLYHQYAEFLRGTGQDDVKTKKEIVDLSNDWLDVQKDITDEYADLKEEEQKVYEKEIDLQEARLKNLEASGAGYQERIAQMREMQRSYHEYANYLRGIGASEEEILELSTKWYQVQADITEEYEKERERLNKIAEDLQKELETAIDAELERAQKARDKEIAAIDAELDRMRKLKDAQKETVEMDEKRKAILEAQQKVLDAQNERTIRIYNAEKNQWEWIADQSKVNSAKDALASAKKDLDDYKDELAYNAAVEALNARKEAINAAYDDLEAEMRGIVKAFEEPARSMAEILDDVAENAFPRVKAQIENIATALGNLNNYINAATGGSTGDSYAAGSSKRGGTGGGPTKDYSNDTTDYSALMDKATTYDEYQYWEGERNKKIAAQNIDVKAEGFRTNEEIYASKTFDKGGILRGKGGIKATSSAEMILPPGLTDSMLSPGSDALFRQRAAEMGYLYGLTNKPPALSGANYAGLSSNTYNNGGNIYINGMKIDDQTAVAAFKGFLRSTSALSVYKNQMA